MRAFLLAAALLGGCSSAHPPERPPLHVMTSLPLFLAEGGVADILQNRAAPSPLVTGLGAHWHIQPLDVARPTSLAAVKTLLLAQPPALAPDELVAIDEWVRAGGRVVILADPELRWMSTLPDGDPRRPPRHSLLGPLLRHWGLDMTADAPANESQTLVFKGKVARLNGTGRWGIAKGAPCRLLASQLVRCRIGSGVVMAVSDADGLVFPLGEGAGSDGFDLLDALISAVQGTDPPERGSKEPENVKAKGTDSS